MSNPVGAQRYGLGGGDAYYDAVKYGGYTGTREQFGRDQAEFAENATAVAQAKEEVERNTQTVVNTAQTFTEETVPAAIQSVEEKGDTEEDRLEARTTELVQSVNTAGALQVQAVEDEGAEQIGLVSGAGTAQVEVVEQAGSDQVDAVELAGSTQVGNVNNAGTTQVGNVNSAGSTQIQAVNTAGGNQVQAVEDKGNEVLESIPADYTVLDQDVDNLKSTLNVYAVKFTIGNITTSGTEGTNSNFIKSDFIPVNADTMIYLYDVHIGESANAYSFYDSSKTFISGQNNISGNITVTTIPQNASFVRLCTQVSSGYSVNFKAFVGNQDSIGKDILLLNPQSAFTVDFVSGNIGTNGNEGTNTNFIKSDFVPVTGNSVLFLTDIYVGDSANGYSFYNSNREYISGSNRLSGNYIITAIPQNAKYVRICTQISGGHSQNFKALVGNQEVINKAVLNNIDNITYALKDAKILIFGDSITDCCQISVNSDKETTAYAWKNPSNSYTDAGGNTVRYSMWPKILKENQPTGEIRNYAYSGAQFQTQSRTSGNERQNLQYQIDVAMNDLDNPNNVFSVANYVPDIVIFAIGTNDNSPTDTYAEAMAKTVLKADGYTIDVDATLANLDDTETFESARMAFMRIKKEFPMAQIYCVLPIQESINDNFNTFKTNLTEMAERYGCIIIDGAADSGITRDFNTYNSLGVYLKDGIHPNEKGQNLMARMIISKLKSHYVPFGLGFNA